MASGSWTFGTGNGYIHGMVNWYSSSNGSSANSSNVSVAVYFRRTNFGYTSYGKVNTYAVITGGGQQNETNFSVSMSDPNTWTLVYAKGWTVGHNSDGSKSINIHVWGNGNFSIGSYDTNNTVWLDKIPRYTSINTWNVAEVGKTYAKINWATADTIDWLRVYLNDSSQWTDNPGSQNGSSGSFIYTGAASSGAGIPSVSTLKPRTTYRLKCWARRKDSQLATMSGNLSFTTSPVATISNLSNGFEYTIGDDITLTFDNYSANKSWLAFYLENDSGGWEQILKTDEVIQTDSLLWALPSYKSVFYSKLSNTNSKKCKIECGTTITENNQTINYISSSIEGTIKVANSDPIFTDFDFGDINGSVQNVLGNISYGIEGKSQLKITIPSSKKAVAKNGASVVKYVISFNTSSTDSYSLSYSDKDISKTFDANNFNVTTGATKSEIQIFVQAVDSRGNKSQTVSKTYTLLSYRSPYFSSINIGRLNDYEAETVLDFKANITRLIVGDTNKNVGKTVAYKYAEVGTDLPSAYTTINGASNTVTSTQNILTFSQNTQDDTFGVTGIGDSNKLILDNNKSYQFRFVITDSLTSSTFDVILEQGIPIMFIGDNGQVSVGAVPDITRTEKLQVQGDILGSDSWGYKFGVMERMDNMILESVDEPTNQPIGAFWLKIK